MTESSRCRLQLLRCPVRPEYVVCLRDSIKSHENFKAKQEFPFELLSDADEKACKLFDVIKEKNMYGRKVLDIERSTFLIDGSGTLKKEWRKVQVKGHVDEVLEAIKEL